MFLRKTSRFKDGKRHDYWSVAENARSGTRVVQRQLLYLGEIDEDRQNAWLNAIDELEERRSEDARDFLIPPQPEMTKAILVTSLALAAGCVSVPKVDNAPVATLDLNRYLGEWYEIARFDHSFERVVEQAKANYSLKDDGTIEAVNSGSKNGNPKTAHRDGHTGAILIRANAVLVCEISDGKGDIGAGLSTLLDFYKDFANSEYRKALK